MHKPLRTAMLSLSATSFILSAVAPNQALADRGDRSRPSRPDMGRGSRPERPSRPDFPRTERPSRPEMPRTERPSRPDFPRSERPSRPDFPRPERPSRPVPPTRTERPMPPRTERPVPPTRTERPQPPQPPRNERPYPPRREDGPTRPQPPRNERPLPPRRDERPQPPRRDERPQPPRRDERPQPPRNDRPGRHDDRWRREGRGHDQDSIRRQREIERRREAVRRDRDIRRWEYDKHMSRMRHDRQEWRNRYHVRVINRPYVFTHDHWYDRYSRWYGYCPRPAFYVVVRPIRWYVPMPAHTVWTYSQVESVALNLESLTRDIYGEMAATANGSEYSQRLLEVLNEMAYAAENYSDAVQSNYDFTDSLNHLFYLESMVDTAEYTLAGYSRAYLVDNEMRALRYYVNELLWLYRQQY